MASVSMPSVAPALLLLLLLLLPMLLLASPRVFVAVQAFEDVDCAAVNRDEPTWNAFYAAGSHSACTDMQGRELVYLDRQRVGCTSNNALLNRFQLANDCGGVNRRFYQDCIGEWDAGAPALTCHEYTTPCNDDGGFNFLDRHSFVCEDTHPISQWRGHNCGNGQVGFFYSCCAPPAGYMVDTAACTLHSTPCHQSGGHNIGLFQLHDLHCADEHALTWFQMSPCDGGSFFNFKCCPIVKACAGCSDGHFNVLVPDAGRATCPAWTVCEPATQYESSAPAAGANRACGECSALNRAPGDGTICGDCLAGFTHADASGTTSCVDITPPELVSTVPTRDAVDVASDVQIQLEFNEPVKAGTGNILVLHRSFDNSKLGVL